jgi:membrane fusion protein, multidrug efflux system
MYLPLMAIMLIVAAGCGDGETDGVEDDETARALRVESLLLESREFQEVIEVTGAVEATDDAVLSAQANGSVVTLASLGQFVRAGQVVAQLDPRIPEAAVRQAQAQVDAARSASELAEDNLRRNEPLYRDSVISPLEFENVRSQASQARANLAQAEAALAQAREQLRNTRVTAPFSGTVEEHFVRRGEQITAGARVARIVSTARVKVRAGVPERYAGDVTRGTRVMVDLRAYDGIGRRPATVTFVGGAVDPQNRTFPIEVEIANPDGTIKPEMVASVYVTRSQIPDVIVLPRPALMREETGYMVYVVDRNGTIPRAERRAVSTGASYANEIVVSAGLAEGEEVIVLGQNNVSHGDPLNIVEMHQTTREVLDVDESAAVLPPA